MYYTEDDWDLILNKLAAISEDLFMVRGVSGKLRDWACCMRYDLAIENPITSSYYAIFLQYTAVIEAR